MRRSLASLSLVPFLLAGGVTAGQEPPPAPAPTPDPMPAEVETPADTAPAPAPAPSMESPAARTAARDALELLPVGTVLVVGVSDLDGVRRAGGENRWVDFLTDERVRPLTEHLFGALRQGLAQDADEAGLDLDPAEVLASVHGSVHFFVAPAGDQMEPSLGFLVDPGADGTDFAAFFEQLTAHFASHADFTIEELENGELASLRTEGELDHTVLLRTDGVYAFLGARGRDAALDVAGEIVQRAGGRGEGPGLARGEALSAARDAVGRGTRHAELFVDLDQLMHVTGAGDDVDAQTRQVLELLGLDQVDWVYARAGLGAGETLDVEVAVELPPEGRLREWLDLFGPRPTDLAARWVPAQADSIALCRYDLHGLFRSVLDVVRKQSTDAYRQVRGGMDMMSRNMGVDLEKDLLEQLTGEFVSFGVQVPEHEALGAMGLAAAGIQGLSDRALHRGSATVIGLRRPERVESFLDQVLTLSGADEMVSLESFQGRTIFVLGDADAGVTVQWSFVEGGVVVSSYPSAMRAALRRASASEEPGALDAEKWKRALAGAGSSSAVSVADTRTSMRAGLALAATLRGLLGAQMSAFGDSGLGAPAFLKAPWPDPATADDHFSGTVLFALRRGAGSFGFSLRAR